MKYMTNLPRIFLALAAAAFVLAPAWTIAAPLESAIPAGRTGKLQIRIEVGHGKGQASRRSMEMELKMVSEQTAAAHMLQDGMDEDLQAQAEHRNAVGHMIESGSDTFAPLQGVDLSSCSRDEGSPECARAMRAMQEATANMNRLSEQVKEKEAAGPALTSQNRYQSWSTSFERGCGTLVARMNVAGAPAEIRMPENDSVDARVKTCGTMLVIDRRARQVTLAIKPANVTFPVKGKYKGVDFLDFIDLEEDAGAESSRISNSLTIRKAPIKGSETAFAGSKTYRSPRGVVTTVQWEFGQDR